MDSITLVVGGRGRGGPGLGKIRTTIQLGKIRITIPGRVQMSDKAGFQILDTFWGPTHTKKKWFEGGCHSKSPKYCWKGYFINISEPVIRRGLIY